MSNGAWGLPQALTVNGKEYSINADARKVEYILEMYQNAELEQDEKHSVCLRVLFRDWQKIPVDDYAEAVNAALRFIDGGGESGGTEEKRPSLVCWRQDLPLIVSTINTMLGRDIRDAPVHWWTFLGYFQNIPSNSLFSLVIDIRAKLRKGKLKDKGEREFYRKNRDIIDIHAQYSDAEKEVLSEWGIKPR